MLGITSIILTPYFKPMSYFKSAKIFFFSFLLFFSLSTKLIGYQYDLAICALFRDEAPYLKEWIEFHKLVGVQHFYLFNNLSVDNYMQVLEPYIARGEVDLIQWPHDSYQKGGGKWDIIQKAAYSQVLKITRSKVKWLAVLDSDEFLFPTQVDNLLTFLADFEDVAGICVNWICFGTSNVETIPPNKLMIELLTMRNLISEGSNKNVKSIVRPEYVTGFYGPHVAIYKPGYYQVNENKERFDGILAPSITVNKIRVNHYWTRDNTFFYRTKIARRQMFGQDVQSILGWARMLNTEQDTTIFSYIPKLKVALGMQ